MKPTNDRGPGVRLAFGPGALRRLFDIRPVIDLQSDLVSLSNAVCSVRKEPVAKSIHKPGEVLIELLNGAPR